MMKLEFEVNDPEAFGMTEQQLDEFLSAMLDACNEMIKCPGFSLRNTPAIFYTFETAFDKVDNAWNYHRERVGIRCARLAASAIVIAAASIPCGPVLLDHKRMPDYMCDGSPCRVVCSCGWRSVTTGFCTSAQYDDLFTAHLNSVLPDAS